VADRAAAYNMPAEMVDGNDVFAVYEATRRALEHARSGKGPYLIECKTFRMTGHSAHDAAHYVPAGLFDEWGKLDPITRLEAKMLENGWAEQANIDALRARIQQEIDAAVAWAENSPFPDPATLLDDVYESR
jgi:pyruvate dehydrogenase E1 component alpha subunit